MDFSSSVTSLGTSFIIFVVLMLVFSWLSRKPGNAVVYYPNWILKGVAPWEGSGPRNPFAWIREVMASSEQDVINVSGVDTAVYFVFMGTVLGILVLSGIILLPVLLPVAVTDNGLKSSKNSTSNGTFSDLDKLSMGNVEHKSPRLWAFLVSVYWVSFVTYYLLWKAYKHVTELRADALMSPELIPRQFAVLVRDLPAASKGQSRKEQVDSYFKSIYPDTFYRSMVVTNNKQVNKIYEELEGYKKKLAHAEAIYEESKKIGKPEGRKPTTKTGFLGLVGKKVDAIDYYNEKINELIPKLETENKVTLREKQLGAALVFFNSRLTAASAAQALHSHRVDEWTVTDAPGPKELLWTNLKFKFFERQTRRYVIYAIVALTILFSMIPIGLISALSTLDNLEKILPFLKPVVNVVEIRTVLEAYLPQLALAVFLALLPKFLLFISKAEGIPSEGHAVRAASGKYFYFTVLNVFIGVTLGGTLFSTFQIIQNDATSIVTILAKSLPANATFFLTFVVLNFFVGYGLELSRIVPFITFHLKRKYLCKTEAEVKEAWFPGDLGYGTRIPADLLIVTITLCYSVIAPLIIPVGVVYFALGWLILRNQALKVYVPAYESYGRIWPHIFVRLVAALLLYQVTMAGYFGVKKFYYTPFVVPLPMLSLLFVYVCHEKFYRFYSSMALEVARRELKETPDMEQVFTAYVPPSLSFEKVDDDQFDDALSQVSQSGSFV